MQNEGHAAEINTVAFAPSSSYLLLTGSSDHVGPQRNCVDHRLLPCGISESFLSNFTLLNLTPTTFFKLLGRLTLRCTLLQRAQTVEFISGTSRRSAKSKRRTMPKMGHQNSCSFTAGTRPGSATCPGVRSPSGMSLLLRTTIFCRFGSRRGISELPLTLTLGQWSWSDFIQMMNYKPHMRLWSRLADPFCSRGRVSMPQEGRLSKPPPRSDNTSLHTGRRSKRSMNC